MSVSEYGYLSESSIIEVRSVASFHLQLAKDEVS